MSKMKMLTAAESCTGDRSWAVGPPTQVSDTWSDRNLVGSADGMTRMSLAATLPGKLAAAKALHPAADVGPQRWPDQAANETCVLQNTDVFTLNRNGADPTKPWNLTIWLTSFLDVPIVCTTNVDLFNNINDGISVDNCSIGQVAGKTYSFFYSSQWGNVDRHPGVDFQQARITARSATCDLIANATSNQGIVYASQYTPDQALMPDMGAEAVTAIVDKIVGKKMLEFFAKYLKDNGSDSETEEEVPDLTDKFSSMSFGPVVPDPHYSTGTFKSPAGNETNYRYVFQNWPWNPQLAMQVSPSSYMAKADEGVYMPLKHCSDSLKYYACSLECYLAATVPNVETQRTSNINILPTGDWCQGVIVFSGLDPNAIVSLKVISALELAPRSDSQLAKFTEEAPPLDKMALEHTRAAMGNMPDAFPAKDNVLGGIAKWVMSALASSGIPIVQQLAQGAEAVNRMTGEAGTNWLDRNVF
jgi:hypothetical protein